jgi:molecular chaperone GrpE
MIDPKEQNLSGIDIAAGNIKEHQQKMQDSHSLENNQENKTENLEAFKKENESLKEEIKKLLEQVEEFKDNWARERAEFSNYRKRMQQEILLAKNLGIEEFAKKLFTVIDNLDMVLASKSENPEVQNFIFGVDMIRSEFLKILQNYFILPFVEKGDKFNPMLMEAIDVEIRDDLNEEKVLEVYKKAYIKHDPQDKNKYLVLRTASVKVGKPKEVINNQQQYENSNNMNQQ